MAHDEKSKKGCFSLQLKKPSADGIIAAHGLNLVRNIAGDGDTR